ncbi:SHOCT domain-containing protein [Leptospira andrefontaineae]|uniref:SHOCT domain-containing protein n=1 Tax=Leptospira andrefontaineae TaxID=2484976 RepID=A0A4R9H1E3_9LEPT|nr:SHOCT domain-containing protein [Leptospira andrefontaineae]TGK38125.1 SHOCT domain-containing protein [Leptospira andrefontaineae]
MAACLKKPIRAKKKNLKLLSFFLTLLFTIYCLSSQRKGMASSSDSIVLYYLKKSSETPLFLQAETWLPIASGVLTGAGPDQLDKTEFISRWEKLFKFTGVSETGVFNSEPVRLFTEEESFRLGELLYKAEIEIPDGLPQAYQVIIKREDPIRPGLRIRRTIFYIRNTPEGIVLEFSEIGQVLDFQTTYSFRDWTLVPISKPEPSSRNSIYLPEIRPEGLEYLNAVTDGEDIRNRILVKNVFWTANPSKKNVGTPTKKIPKTIEDRLRTLQELLDKGLISKQEYEKKKAEILKEL